MHAALCASACWLPLKVQLSLALQSMCCRPTSLLVHFVLGTTGVGSAAPVGLVLTCRLPSIWGSVLRGAS